MQRGEIMDNQARKKFWDTLCTLDGIDKKQDEQKLTDAIQYPQHLYRFRPVSFSSLDGLQNNKLYFSSADHYDDPFDSFLHIDIPRIENEVKEFFNARKSWGPHLDRLSNMFGIPKDQLGAYFSSLELEPSSNMVIGILEQIQHIVQSEMQSICFCESEDGLNEQLWLKYAENHSGFVLEYDMTDNGAFLCGKQKICENCHAKDFHYPVYPVYYATEKYDATIFARNTAIVKASAFYPKPVQDIVLAGVPASLWERERIALIKKQCHEHDEEWRMIYSGPAGGRPYICWRPSSVTLGLKMSPEKRSLVFTLSKVAGIPHIYECYTENGELKRKMLG